MNHNKKTFAVRGLLVLLILAGIIVVVVDRCIHRKSEERATEIINNGYSDLIRYTISNYSNYSSVMKNSLGWWTIANFYFDFDPLSIEVHFAEYDNIYNSTGELSALKIEEIDEEGYYPVSLTGKWDIIGDMRIMFSEMNVLVLDLYSGSRTFTLKMGMDHPDEVLAILNETRSKLSEIDGLERITLQPLNNGEIDWKVLALLRKVYPNTLEEPDGYEYSTERFKEYALLECDHHPIYNTQDAYSAAILPNPSFSKYPSVENAYMVEWERYDWREKVSCIVVLCQENGDWKIDNVIENGNLIFDYSKPAEQWWL